MFKLEIELDTKRLEADGGLFIVEGDWIRTFKKYGKW